MKKKMRVMTEKPLNAETPIESLRTWTTDNAVFFKRNQGQIMQRPVKLATWKLSIDGLVENNITLSFEEIRRMPKAEVANTLECSGNSRSLLTEKASGNPWTIGGVGNAIWGGCWLKDLLARAELKKDARHVSFEGFDKPLGKAGIKFIRSIRLQKAMDSTLLAYEMNGQPLPLKHGYPLRALALGWTGANCVKWLHKITVLDQPHEGFFMDNVYRVFQKGEDPKTVEVVKEINIKSIIVEPANAETIPAGIVPIRGAAYAGEAMPGDIGSICGRLVRQANLRLWSGQRIPWGASSRRRPTGMSWATGITASGNTPSSSRSNKPTASKSQYRLKATAANQSTE
jgi:DMSO/TMAO reductase YedYZ molybdopterin-dependent catalytic subunit